MTREIRQHSVTIHKRIDLYILVFLPYRFYVTIVEPLMSTRTPDSNWFCNKTLRTGIIPYVTQTDEDMFLKPI